MTEQSPSHPWRHEKLRPGPYRRLKSGMFSCDACGREFELRPWQTVCPHCEFDHSPRNAAPRHDPGWPDEYYQKSGREADE